MPVSHTQASNIVNNLWNKYDNDHSGSLDIQEAKKLFTLIFSNEGIDLNNAQHNSIFQAIDMNGDGKISKDEMIKLLVEYS